MKKGDVVVIPFPFREAVGAKLRPALILATLGNNEAITCMIISTEIADGYSIALNQQDFAAGDLPHASFIRPNRLFTIDTGIVVKPRGTIHSAKLAEVTTMLKRILGT